MVPSGPPPPVGSAQSIPSSLLRTNSGLLGGVQPASIPSQQPFSSLVSPRAQFISGANGNNIGLLGGISNVSSLLNHSFGNGAPASDGGGFSTPQMNSLQRSGISSSSDMLSSAEPDTLSFPSSSGFQNSSVNQMESDRPHSQSQQLEAMQNFQQFSVPHGQQQQLRGGIGQVVGMGPVKLELQMSSSDQSMRGIGPVKMEPQQLQSMRSLGPVKLEQQNSDSSIFLQHQQQQHPQQQLLQMSRSNSHAAAAHLSLLQQQRLLQLQQQQQHQQQHQQLIKTLPQRVQLQQHLQHGLPIRPQMKPTMYEPGMCARRLTQYMYHQLHKPEDNNIEFWRKFVTEFFAPNAKKRWCVSLYGTGGRQTTGVFPQDVWHCEICNRKPGRGFEATVEVLPRLLQIKYASGTLEELLYVDMPRESQNTSGQIVLDYAKAVQESVFDQLRVVRDGQLRIVFNPDLKISSWEFCARRHEELIPRRLIIPQVTQLGSVVQKYQTASQNSSSGLTIQDLQNTCNSFVASARQLAKALEVPLVNDLGYTKRYVRCLQISEVVNSMKDLIDFSRETGTGPMDSLINFPRRSSSSSSLHSQQHQQQDSQHNVAHNSSQNGQNGQNLQLGSSNNGVASVNNSLNSPSTSTSATPIIGLIHQNAMNSRQENQMSHSNNPYASGNHVQISSTSSSNSIPPSQPNPSSPFPPNSDPNNNAAPSNMPPLQAQTTQSHEPDPSDSQSSVQQILQEMMLSSQFNGVNTLANDMKGINSAVSGLNGSNCVVGNVIGNNLISNFGGMGGIASSVSATGLRAATSTNAMAINGRVGTNQISLEPSAMNLQQQQDIGNHFLRGIGSVNSFNSLQFDWKPSP